MWSATRLFTRTAAVPVIYINDIHTCSNLLSFILFADDTNLFISGKNIKELESLVKLREIKRVQAGTHNPYRASPFLDTFLGNFSHENGISATSMDAFEV